MQRNCSGRMMNRWVVGRAGCLSTTTTMSPGVAHEQKSTEELMEAVRSTYRALFRLVHRLPSAKERENSVSQLRTQYRKTPTGSDESSASTTTSLADQIHEAGKKIAYLRIMTPKDRRVHDGRVEQWVYKADGSKVPLKESNSRPSNANRVVSNWNGKNMDPCMVNRHNTGLRRAGFVNNLHAKGMF
jgi:hypothetical protein